MASSVEIQKRADRKYLQVYGFGRKITDSERNTAAYQALLNGIIIDDIKNTIKGIFVNIGRGFKNIWRR